MELGKTLAKEMRHALSLARKEEQGFGPTTSLDLNPSTSSLISSYLDMLSRQRGLFYSEAFHNPFEGFCTTGDECQIFLEEHSQSSSVPRQDSE